MTMELTTYRIARGVHNGVPLFALDGGMSAEYGVQEALASLSGGVAHTWDVQAPGLGPNPVRASRRFLRDSVDSTIDAYESLGPQRTFDTVVMGTGVSSASYIAHALGAPFLPLHFLASTDSIAETADALNGALDEGLPAYATLAYDESMPTLAVAWLKMLSVPAPYLEFLRRHQVKNVVLIGTRGASPHFARRPAEYGGGEIQAGQVLVTWPDAGSKLDETWLNRTIRDLGDTLLEPLSFLIADWESGLGEEQIKGVQRDLAREGVALSVLTATDYVAAYSLGTYVHAALLRSNDMAVQEIALNPYLITHPLAEALTGALPLLYWQLDSPEATMDRLEQVVSDASGMTLQRLRDLPVVVNATLNVGGPEHAVAIAQALESRGYSSISTLDTSADEVLSQRADTPVWRAIDAIAGNRLRSLNSISIVDIESAVQHLPTVSLTHF